MTIDEDKENVLDALQREKQDQQHTHKFAAHAKMRLDIN